MSTTRSACPAFLARPFWSSVQPVLRLKRGSLERCRSCFGVSSLENFSYRVGFSFTAILITVTAMDEKGLSTALLLQPMQMKASRPAMGKVRISRGFIYPDRTSSFSSFSSFSSEGIMVYVVLLVQVGSVVPHSFLPPSAQSREGSPPGQIPTSAPLPLLFP